MDSSLPIPQERSRVTRRYLALNAGREAGWWDWELGPVTPRSADQLYVITLRPSGVRRELLADEVLPWALGVADEKGQPDVVAYRDGLLPAPPKVKSAPRKAPRKKA